MQPTPYGTSRSTSFADRLRGALMLDGRTYREVEQDTNANGQAALIIVLAALAAGIGSILSRDLIQNALGVVLSSVLQWVVFSFVAYYVGASLFSTGQTSATVLNRASLARRVSSARFRSVMSVTNPSKANKLPSES